MSLPNGQGIPPEALGGTIVILGLSTVFWAFYTLLNAIRLLLGLVLLIAGFQTSKGHRSGRWLHLAWAIMTIPVEVTIAYLSGGHDVQAWVGSTYAVVLLLILMSSDVRADFRPFHPANDLA